MNDKKIVGDYIRSNLSSLGIEDMVVDGTLYYSDNQIIGDAIKFCDGERAGTLQGILSNFCSLCYFEMASQLGINPMNVSSYIEICVGGRRIGRIGSDGYFDFEAALDIRTALAWRIATDGGRVRSVEFFDIDRATELIVKTIQRKGTKSEVFFGDYLKVLKRVFVYQYVTRFSDGYCSAAMTLWRTATRQIGEEHPGYEFSY